MWTWKLSFESTQKKTRKKRGRRGGAVWFSPAQSRQEVSSGYFQPKGSEVQWRRCQSVLTYQLKKGRGFHQHWLVVQPLVLWVSFDYGALFSPRHTEKAVAKTRTILRPASPSAIYCQHFPKILLEITFYSYIGLPWHSLALLKQRSFLKVSRRKALCFAPKLGIFSKTCELIQLGNMRSCSASWGISLLGFLNITSWLSLLFCTQALLQINFQAGEVPSQIILWWNHWMLQGSIDPSKSNAHVQPITHGKVRQN